MYLHSGQHRNLWELFVQQATRIETESISSEKGYNNVLNYIACEVNGIEGNSYEECKSRICRFFNKIRFFYFKLQVFTGIVGSDKEGWKCFLLLGNCYELLSCSYRKIVLIPI